MLFKKFQSRKKKIDYHHRFKKPALGRASRVYYLAGRRKWQKRILISLFTLMFAGIFYFLFYSDYSKIRVKIVDMSQGSENDGIASPRTFEKNTGLAMTEEFLNQKKFYIFSQRNIFLFDKNQLEEIILARYNLEELKISKKFPNKLEIKIKEKLPSLVLNYQGDSWFLDGEGKILEKINVTLALSVRSPSDLQGRLFRPDKENLLPLVFVDFSLTDSARPEISVNQEIFSKERVHFIKEVSLGLPEIIKDFKGISTGTRGSFPTDYVGTITSDLLRMTWFVIPAEKETKIIAKTQEGWEIYFDEMLSPEEQLNNLKLILKEKVKGERKNLKYIDLRFGERVYYR